jgi:hypothetical protein
MAAPPPGSVIRYAYLWADEQRRGAEEGRKDRPTLVLALAVRDDNGNTQILAAAITHVPPARPTDAVELPDAAKRKLGLDTDASWIVTTEANVFVWPGPDIRPIPSHRPPGVIYGRVPRSILVRAVRSYLANRERQRVMLVVRSQ